MLRMTPLGKKIDLESKLSLREKQRAKRKAKKEREEEFEAKTGKKRPLQNYEEYKEKFYYDMARNELKE